MDALHILRNLAARTASLMALSIVRGKTLN